MESSDKREVRAARNQALFRAVNEKVLSLNEVFQNLVGTFAIACECAQIDCVTLIEIPPGAYRAVRASPRTFAVCPGHVDLRVERVVSRHPNFVVVEAIGSGVAVVEATFPARGREAVAGLRRSGRTERERRAAEP